MNTKKGKIKKESNLLFDQIKRWYFLLSNNYQTSFLHFGQRDEYPRKGFYVYYDSYADFKKQQKKTRLISFSSATLVLSIIIVELFINLIFPVIFRSEAAGGSVWAQVNESDFLAGQVDSGAVIGDDLELRADKKIKTIQTKEDFFGSYIPAKEGQNMAVVSGVLSSKIGINQGYTYNKETKISLPSNQVMHSFFDNESGDIFVSTLSGLAVIDTKKTVDNNDDVLLDIFNMNSAVQLSGNLVYKTWLDQSTHYLYVCTGSGLDVLDITQGIKTAKKIFTYNSKSTPGLKYNKVKDAFIDSGVLYVSTDGGGLAMIDTKNTPDLLDDVLLGNWGKGTIIDLETDRISGIVKNENILYISTWGSGVKIIDIKGTNDLSDDVLLPSEINTGKVFSFVVADSNEFIGLSAGGLVVQKNGKIRKKYLSGQDVSSLFWDKNNSLLYVGINGGGVVVYLVNDSGLDQLFLYNTRTEPRIMSDAISSISLASGTGEVYLSSQDGGLQVLTPGNYNKKGILVSRPFSFAELNPKGISWEDESSSSSPSSIQIRVAKQLAVWQMDISQINTDEFVDLWGGIFSKIENIPGAIRLSGREDEKQGASFTVKASLSDKNFPAGSIIRAKIKINTSANSANGTIFADNWNGLGANFSGANDWQNVVYVADSAFSSIGFSLRWKDGWQPNDSLDIAYLSIESPDVSWGAWSRPLTNKNYSALPFGDDQNYWWQYRVNLQTSNQKQVSAVSNIDFWGDYRMSGSYMSSSLDAGEVVDWSSFLAETIVPEKTSIKFFVRDRQQESDEWMQWKAVPSQDQGFLASSRFLQYRVDLFSNDNLVTPKVLNVKIKYFKNINKK